MEFARSLRNTPSRTRRSRRLGGSVTIQASDSFLFKGKRYALFDVSNNQTLSCKLCAGIPDNTIACTANRKGFLATYEVRDGMLLYQGARSAQEEFDLTTFFSMHRPNFDSSNSKPRATKLKPLAEPGCTIPFTGHVIITQGARTDFFSLLSEADKALELEFDEGLLVQSVDLKPFTSAMRAYQESLPHDERGIIIWDGALSSCANAVNALEASCPELPRGTYSKHTLVNRLSNATCALCGNVISSS